MARLLLVLLILLSPGIALAQRVSTPPPAAGSAPPLPAQAPVILISIDGFRADYLTRGYTPTLLRLARQGVWASEGMRPAFPSITFPNHYTLVTGLTPDHHGIVANTMDDPSVTGDTHFTISNVKAVSDGRWWSQATPIWVTAQQAALRSATLFWPGSEAEIAGERPTRFTHFDDAMAPNTRVDMLLDWLDLPLDKRPTFLTLYFDRVDHQGHLAGPASPQVNAALAETDRAIARLLTGLRRRGLDQTANLVIVADHGMAATSPDRVVYVDDWGVPPGAVKQTSGGPFATFTPEGADAAAVEAAILNAHDHVRCWRKADIPARLRYGTNPRIPPLLCLAEPGWEVTTRASAAKVSRFSLGEHGYDPAAPDMAALFIASGPAFRRGYRQPVFDNVDVEPLVRRALRIAPSGPTDADWAVVAGMISPTWPKLYPAPSPIH